MNSTIQLNIKNPEARRLADEISELTGESVTKVVTDALRERLERERDISAASTWTDRATAEETVAAALRANQSKIDRWNDRGFPRTNLALHFDAGRAIGRTLRHGESTVEPCASAVVVLKADRIGGFFVLTTYPEDRE